MATYNDQFNRPNEELVNSSDWEYGPMIYSAAYVANNQARGSAGENPDDTNCVMWAGGGNWGFPQEAEAEIGADHTKDSYTGVAILVTQGDGGFYHFSDNGSGNFRLSRYTSDQGAFITLRDYSDTSLDPGEKIGLRAEDDGDGNPRLIAYIRETQAFTETDTSSNRLTSGRPGLFFHRDQGRLDNFTATDSSESVNQATTSTTGRRTTAIRTLSVGRAGASASGRAVKSSEVVAVGMATSQVVGRGVFSDLAGKVDASATQASVSAAAHSASFARGHTVGQASTSSSTFSPAFQLDGVFGDNFVRPTQDLINNDNWDDPCNITSYEVKVDNGQVRGQETDQEHTARWIGGGFWGLHQSATVTIGPDNQQYGDSGICVLTDEDGFYMGQVDYADGAIELDRYNGTGIDFDNLAATSFTDLGFTPSSGDTIEIESQDDGNGNPTLIVRVNGVDQITYTDVSTGQKTSGNPGLFFYSDGIHFEAFRADDFASRRERIGHSSTITIGFQVGAKRGFVLGRAEDSAIGQAVGTGHSSTASLSTVTASARAVEASLANITHRTVSHSVASATAFSTSAKRTYAIGRAAASVSTSGVEPLLNTSYLDNFDRSNQTLIDSPEWDDPINRSSSEVVIDNNQIRGETTDVSHAARFIGRGQWDDLRHSAAVKIGPDNVQDSGGGPLVCITDSGHYYAADMVYVTSSIALRRWDGSGTTLAELTFDSLGFTPSTGDIIGIQVDDDGNGNPVLSVSVNGTPYITFTDTTTRQITGGNPGVLFFSTAVRFSQFRANDFSLAPQRVLSALVVTEARPIVRAGRTVAVGPGGSASSVFRFRPSRLGLTDQGIAIADARPVTFTRRSPLEIAKVTASAIRPSIKTSSPIGLGQSSVTAQARSVKVVRDNLAAQASTSAVARPAPPARQRTARMATTAAVGQLTGITTGDRSHARLAVAKPTAFEVTIPRFITVGRADTAVSAREVAKLTVQLGRQVSYHFAQAVTAAETAEAFLVLLTIDHEDLDEPIRITSDSVDTESNGNTFQPFPFKISLPTDDDDNRGTIANVTIDAVDRRVVRAARTISGVPRVTVEIVLGSDPDLVEISWPTFNLSNHVAEADTISGDLVLEVLDQEPFPVGRFDPARFAGLF